MQCLLKRRIFQFSKFRFFSFSLARPIGFSWKPGTGIRGGNFGKSCKKIIEDSHATRHGSRVTCHGSCVTCHGSHVTCHGSRVTCHGYVYQHVYYLYHSWTVNFSRTRYRYFHLFSLHSRVNHEPWHVTHEPWHVIRDEWHVTHEPWHVIRDEWHVTIDTWNVNNDTRTISVNSVQDLLPIFFGDSHWLPYIWLQYYITLLHMVINTSHYYIDPVLVVMSAPHKHWIHVLYSLQADFTPLPNAPSQTSNPPPPTQLFHSYLNFKKMEHSIKFRCLIIKATFITSSIIRSQESTETAYPRDLFCHVT